MPNSWLDLMNCELMNLQNVEIGNQIGAARELVFLKPWNKAKQSNQSMELQPLPSWYSGIVKHRWVRIPLRVSGESLKECPSSHRTQLQLIYQSLCYVNLFTFSYLLINDRTNDSESGLEYDGSCRDLPRKCFLKDGIAGKLKEWRGIARSYGKLPLM